MSDKDASVAERSLRALYGKRRAAALLLYGAARQDLDEKTKLGRVRVSRRSVSTSIRRNWASEEIRGARRDKFSNRRTNDLHLLELR
jgi:hypothetical protein